MLTVKHPQNVLKLLRNNLLSFPPHHHLRSLTTTSQLAKSLAVESLEKLLPDDPDGYDKQEFDLEPRKNAYYYKYEISKYARQGSPGLRRALELFQEMKAKGRLTPSTENFSPLIYGCAKAGYTKRAFELYEESLRYEKKPTRSVITCLIKACAESPFPEYGLKRLDWFLDHVRKEHGTVFNLIHYNAAIKAYGKLGRLDQASRFVQEMLERGHYPDSYTFNALLAGCISNKESGCSLALRVYKRMKLYEVQRTTDTYHLLLRCIRDCDIGSKELLAETLAELPAVTSMNQRIKYRTEGRVKEFRSSKKKLDSPNFEWAPLITDLGKSISKAIGQSTTSGQPSKAIDYTTSSQPKITASEINKNSNKNQVDNLLTLQQNSEDSTWLMPIEESERIPNLLSDDHLNLMTRIEAIQLDKLRDGANRIMLFGGLQGYLEKMISDNCKPDTKTFSLILKCIEPSPENFVSYFKLTEVFKIKRDVLFYDLLIETVCDNMRHKERLDLALKFVEDMHRDDLRPNITTFEALASGCNKWPQAFKLITDVERSGFVLSDNLVKKLFAAAYRRRDFFYLNNLIEFSEQRGYQPTKHLVERLESIRLEMTEHLVKQEKGLLPAGAIITPPRRIAEFDHFKRRLGKWLSKVELQEEEHPWAQFKVESGSKRDGFMNFVKHFKTMEQLKRESLESGRRLGNIPLAAEKARSDNQALVSNSSKAAS